MKIKDVEKWFVTIVGELEVSNPKVWFWALFWSTVILIRILIINPMESKYVTELQCKANSRKLSALKEEVRQLKQDISGLRNRRFLFFH